MARKKAEPKQDPPEQDAVVEEEVSLTSDTAPVDRLGEFPLAEGHYFHPPVTSPRAHHGSGRRDANAVLRLQRALDAPQTGLFDEDLQRAVALWKQEHGLGRSPVVDKDVWDQISRG